MKSYDCERVARDLHIHFTRHYGYMVLAHLRQRSYGIDDPELSSATLALAYRYHVRAREALTRDITYWEREHPIDDVPKTISLECSECGAEVETAEFKTIHYQITYGYYGPGAEWCIAAFCPTCEQPFEHYDGYP